MAPNEWGPGPVWHTIYGPEGEVLRSVQVTAPDAEAKDVTNEKRDAVNGR